MENVVEHDGNMYVVSYSILERLLGFIILRILCALR